MITKTIQLHENQRCWIGKGFSAGGLLPNDRGPYSLRDGTKSWKTLDEATAELMGIGWAEKEKVDKNDETEEANVEEETIDNFSVAEIGGDADSWWYARDCTPQAIRDAQPARRAALHWIRFRTLARRIVWDPSQICHSDVYSKCDRGDSKAVTELAQLLLELVTYVTIVRDGQKPTNNNYEDTAYLHLKEWTMLRTKTEFFLLLKQHEPLEDDAYANIQALRYRLQKFAQELAQAEQTGLGSGLRAVLTGNGTIAPIEKRHSNIPEFDQACKRVAKLHLPDVEASAMATLLVKKLDPHYQMHCNQQPCSETCQFQWEQCSNSGCPAVLSRLYLADHDEHECQYNIISCEDNCGESFPRHARSKHLAEVCPLRIANCPFSRIGCSSIVQAKDIPDHVDADTGSHLLLALYRMMEYEDMIRKLVKENAALKQTMQTHQEGTFQKVKALDQQIAAAQKRVESLEKTQQRDSKRIAGQLRQLERSHVK